MYVWRKPAWLYVVGRPYCCLVFSAHPNLAVFITHGGLLSTTEAIHFGVPIIGIPVFGDQFMNVDKAVNRGFAQRVDLSYTMVDKLKNAIEEVVSNKRYVS